MLRQHAVVRRAWHLLGLRVQRVLVLVVARVLIRAVATLSDLLQQVVLMLAHHGGLALFLALLELVLQTLCVNPCTVSHYLLSRAARNSSTHAHLHAVDTAIQRQQVVLQIYDLHVWFR